MSLHRIKLLGDAVPLVTPSSIAANRPHSSRSSHEGCLENMQRDFPEQVKGPRSRPAAPADKMLGAACPWPVTGSDTLQSPVAEATAEEYQRGVG